MSGYKKVAAVIVDVPGRETDRPFDYLIPDELQEEVEIGSRVLVPFGRQSRMGYVVDLPEEANTTRLRSIVSVMDLTPPLTPELVKLAEWMAERYLCLRITSLHAMVPAVLKGRYQRMLRLHPHFRRETVLPRAEEKLIEKLHQVEELPLESALSYEGITRALIRRLVAEERLIIEERIGDRSTRKRFRYLTPLLSSKKLLDAVRELPPQATRQKEVLLFFANHPQSIAWPELMSQLNVTRSSVDRLVEKGWFIWEEREILRDPYTDRSFKQTQPLSLTEEQQHAYDSIVSSLQAKVYQPILLHGVTGSGKTEIYLQAIAETLQRGREAIVLVPEISLTPQMVERFKGRFGKQVAVLHSRLSDGERFDEWRKIRSGQVQVAIGARSAIFAPFRNLGLIIIDEEHESSYKQVENPKYHAREVAIQRGKLHGAPVVLGTATPAVESYYLAQIGGYQHILLKERVGGRPLPQVEVVDMRDELRQGNRSMFSSSLRQALIDCIDRGEQAVVFLNRRGFSTFVMCRECGETIECPHCDISLTYHHTNRTVRCHYCGYAEPVPAKCPHCQSKHIRYFGTGTQRVEEELVRHFPGIRVIRMDVDTTNRKGAHEKLLTAFGAGKADVLLGTQMIAKGLDFPRVTVVGIIAADTMLHLPDFRAAERTFQLITQVSGRAGRHERPGRVVIQTYNPEHYSVDLAARGEVEQFYRQECKVRKIHRYPPFCGLFSLLFSHPNRATAMKAGYEAGRMLSSNLPSDVEVLGPVPASIPRMKDRYRFQIMVKYPNQSTAIDRLILLLRKIEGMRTDRELRISIDRDTA